MNYRHAYHAGNFADVLKHAVLALAIERLKLKPAAFRVLDTHAGIGVYDLAADAAARTGEWRGGIGKLATATLRPDLAALRAPYLDTVAVLNGAAWPIPLRDLKLYPGSPELAHRLTRPQDRMTFTELHPEDHAALAGRFAGDIRVKAIALDVWLALKSFLPPKERRGLVLVDPPYEAPDDLAAMVAGLKAAHRRFATGVYILWYPIKDEREIEAFRHALAATGIRRMLAIELRVARVVRGAPLAGAGMVVVNPPWQFDEVLARLAPGLAGVLAVGPGAEGRSGWLVPE
jgi:23S rRNA (adenine2030-N6)-methyltransferase